MLERMHRAVPEMVPKAHRWVGEMEEIAKTFGACGLTPLTFEGAAADLCLDRRQLARPHLAGGLAPRAPALRGGRQDARARALTKAGPPVDPLARRHCRRSTLTMRLCGVEEAW